MNESDVKDIQVGAKALVSGTSMGKEKAEATVTRISPTGNEDSKRRNDRKNKSKCNIGIRSSRLCC
ncbi:hypothetical protein [Brevibacillus laterosporus]|uniref:hypothetical protein n=1 Tax=Brevibacillus laterosporus TaxID=1465 RepID=UPI003558D3E8